MEEKKQKFKLKMDIEAMWDYSYELIDEISRLITELPESNLISSNKFIDIFNKLEKAKSLWMKVDSFEQQIYEFRAGIFSSKVRTKIAEIKNTYKNDIFDSTLYETASLELNFQELQADYENISELSEILNVLKNEIHHAKLYRKIKDYMDAEWHAGYDYDNIMTSLTEAKDKWIDISELEMLVMWE